MCKRGRSSRSVSMGERLTHFFEHFGYFGGDPWKLRKKGSPAFNQSEQSKRLSKLSQKIKDLRKKP